MTRPAFTRVATGVARRQQRQIVAVLFALVPLLIPSGSVGASEPAALTGTVDPYLDVVPGALPAAEQAAADLSDVRMDVTLDPTGSTIGGQMTVTWRNPASQPLAEVWFRLFPNAFYYGDGNLTVSAVTVDGAPVVPELTLQETALGVPLPRPIAPGESATIALAFTTTIPADTTGSYGIFNHDTANGAWVLADWYPVLAVYDEGSGWALPEATSFGDPTYAPSAFYDVLLSAPADLAVAATGVEAGQSDDNGVITRRLVAGPSRDFVVVADDNYTSRDQEVAGTRLTLWTAPGLAPTSSERALGVAAGAFRYYSEHFGAYPERDIDYTQLNPSGALGIAWAGLIYLDGPTLLGSYADHDQNGLAAIVGHETAHLWWGVLVGGDSNKHGYIQEGLATISSMLYLREAYGADVASTELDAWVIRPARDLLAAGDAVVDLPTAEGENESIRSNATYGKGTLGFLAIRQTIGAAAFNAALRDVASRYAWGEMTPEQLRQAFEYASGQDLTALWRHWFDETGMTQEEIDSLATAFGAQGGDA